MTQTTPWPSELAARYEFLEEAGRGGMGVVYKARDRETGELVAIKVLRPEVAADRLAADRFINEVRLSRRITHKNVCRVYEFTRAGSVAYLSMEYVEGESLRSILSRVGAVNTRKGVQIARQICAALGEAHAQGIIHRDLKPENVMLDRSGNVKVMDFGIARLLDSAATSTGGVMGTPAYMAPEQAESRPLDPRTDIYAVGLILYELLTGTDCVHRRYACRGCAEADTRDAAGAANDRAVAAACGRRDRDALPREGSRQSLSERRGARRRACRDPAGFADFRNDRAHADIAVVSRRQS